MLFKMLGQQKSLEELQPYLSDALMENWKTKLDWMDIRRERNILENIQLLSRSIVGIYDDIDDRKRYGLVLYRR